MTLKKGNYLEFRFLEPLTSDQSTFRIASAPKMKRADGGYYDLNFNGDSTVSITHFRGTIVKRDGTTEGISVNGVTTDGTTSDGRNIYVCTIEVGSDGSTKLRGLKQNDDGTNAVSNRDDNLVIGTVDINETFKIPWDISAENALESTFTAETTTGSVVAGEALDASSGTLGLSLHTDGKYYKYHSTNYPDLQGMLPRGQNIASNATFTITWLNGTVSTESGLTANTLYYVQDGGTLTTTPTSSTKALANSRGATVLVGIQDLGIESSTNEEITAGTDTVPKLQSAAQIKLGVETHGVSYPRVLYTEEDFSASATSSNTITHNLGVAQADVEKGKYAVAVFSGGRYVSHYNNTLDYFFSPSWSASDPTASNQAVWQANTLKLYNPGASSTWQIQIIQTRA